MTRSHPAKVFLFLVTAVVLGACTSSTEDEQQALIDKANASVERFAADPDMAWFRDNLDEAEGLMIIPTSLKGGFIIGGSGGSGVMLARQHASSEWSYPAFYTMGSVTFGLQIGGEVQEIVLVIMSKGGPGRHADQRVQAGRRHQRRGRAGRRRGQGPDGGRARFLPPPRAGSTAASTWKAQ